MVLLPMSSSLEASRRPSYHSLVRRCISTLAARTSCVCWEERARRRGGGERERQEGREGRGEYVSFNKSMSIIRPTNHSGTFFTSANMFVPVL